MGEIRFKGWRTPLMGQILKLFGVVDRQPHLHRSAELFLPTPTRDRISPFFQHTACFTDQVV
jgi:hypothetical protein|eukprot:COSAG01_NODE_87_length_27454_cov_201.243575_25_plen_62_part_00